ncbi:MAG: GntR family transcriptional regulator [Treponema sp.]|nr:GntR family transcriptional regulator [Treponema sp.]
MNLTTAAYMSIKQDLFQAKYKPNELITEKQISEKYSISKLTASASLHRLCSEGHLTSYPRSGYMVTSLSSREMVNIKRMRVALESLVLEIIFEEANDSGIESLYANINNEFSVEASAAVSNFTFHMNLAKLTNDKTLINLIENLLGSVTRIEQHISPQMHTIWQGYHKAIIDALVAHDIQTAKEYLLKDLNQKED